ncbi:MAG: sodium:solute symporter [Phycisphaerae bacterium]|nr:sodium:solute symporter [Phycisphaerae bacterium]
MTDLDIFVLVAYFVGVGGIGYWSSKRSLDSSKSYFLGGGTIGWLAIGASLFASNISAEHFIGLTGTGAKSGLAVGQYEWLACLILLLLGWLFVPFYHRTGVFTMPEFLETRYNSQCRTYLSAISLIAYVFTKISVCLFAGALVLKAVLGWNIWVAAVVLLVATGIYTIFGGLRAVIYTDLFQAFILIGGSIFLTAVAISRVGGFGALADGVNPEFFNLWKNIDHPEFPWTGILFGAPILGIWYWCTDQMIVQRTLAARNIVSARKATIFAGYLKILPVFILVLPGVAGRILCPEIDVEHNSNDMYAAMVTKLLPAGVKGLVIAALLAALMSSLSSVFNSSSTLVVMDFYKKRKPHASEKQLVRAGQVSTMVLVVAGLLWLPFIGRLSDQLFQYLQAVQAYISPPIAVVFLVGLLWRRANGAGALAALLTGFVLGAVRFVAELGDKADPPWVTWPPLVEYARINFLHVAILLFAISLAVLVVVSLLTARPTERNLSVFPTPSKSAGAASAGRSKSSVGFSVLLVLVVLSLWACFSPWVFGGQP